MAMDQRYASHVRDCASSSTIARYEGMNNTELLTLLRTEQPSLILEHLSN